MPETRPQMQDVVVVDSEENVQLDSWQREASGLFLLWAAAFPHSWKAVRF